MAGTPTYEYTKEASATQAQPIQRLEPRRFEAIPEVSSATAGQGNQITTPRREDSMSIREILTRMIKRPQRPAELWAGLGYSATGEYGWPGYERLPLIAGVEFEGIWKIPEDLRRADMVGPTREGKRYSMVDPECWWWVWDFQVIGLLYFRADGTRFPDGVLFNAPRTLEPGDVLTVRKLVIGGRIR